MQRIPGPTERTLSLNGQRRVFLAQRRVVDVDAVAILKRRVCAFPRGDAAAAAAQGKQAGLDPCGAEAVQEVGLAGDFGIVNVGVAEFADVEGVLVGVEGAVVEPCVCVADGDCERRARGVGEVVVCEV